jgi:hypothetical protein
MRKSYPAGPRVKVQVKKETITKAITADSSRCWIAEAIKEQVPTATHVAVDLATVRFTDPDKGLRYVYLTPYSAQLALLQFDEGTPPAPFSFLLKNAHVTKSGTTLPPVKVKADLEVRDKLKARREREKASKRRAQRIERNAALSTSAQLLTTAHGTSSEIPRRVGGRRPPQLRMLRQFGVRAFRGASKKRLEADAALIEQAES